jgi:glycosyltransferase involved in cell wall biosynthesis
MLGTWQKQVDVYIASSEFYRTKFVEGGLPPERITIKPHFVSCDPGTRTSAGSYAMFVGRFSREKGALTLMKAWETLKHVPLKIRGEGELTGRLTELMRDNTRKIDLMPRLSAVELTDALKGSRFLVWPSEGYSETFGLVAVEAFACGVPVIGSRLGVMAKVVDDGRTGLHFTAGDAGDLAAKVEWAWNHPEEMESMGRAARAEYEAKYTAERNYKMLMDIYQGVIAAQQSHHPALEPLGARPQDIS